MLKSTQISDPDGKVADCVEAQNDAVEEQKDIDRAAKTADLRGIEGRWRSMSVLIACNQCFFRSCLILRRTRS